jgi:hypothetical protein
MTASSLQAALRAGAQGLYALEAATGLIIAHGTWLARDDFADFIRLDASITDPTIEVATIDWEGAIAALEGGGLPSSDLLTELRRASGHADRSWWAGYVHRA